MKNIRKKLKDLGFNPNLYIIEKKEIKDILLKKKEIVQKVETEIKQYLTEYEDSINSGKKSISSNHLFKSHEFTIGTHIINAIEPGTIVNEDCLTCDGHGEITCSLCLGTGEQTCKKCDGKGLIIKEIEEKKPYKESCKKCFGNGRITITCSKCKGAGSIKTLSNCITCKGMGRVSLGIDPQTKKMKYNICPTCNGRKKSEKEITCPICKGQRNKEVVCPECKGTKEKILYKNEKVIKKQDCNYCQKTGRVICSKCQGRQNLICPTCKGQRRTIQYQLNKFKIIVKNNFQLLKTKTLKEEISIISLDKGKDMTYLYEGEKELLKKRATELSLKIGPETTRRIEGSLYSLKLRKSKENILYYFWISSDGKLFYKELPAKNNYENQLKNLKRKILAFFGNTIKNGEKLLDKLSNRKRY